MMKSIPNCHQDESQFGLPQVGLNRHSEDATKHTPQFGGGVDFTQLYFKK